MAFPSTRAARAGTQGTNANPWTLTYPDAGDIVDGVSSNPIEAGDLMLINIARDGASGTGSITGFSLLFNQANGTACRGLTFAKIATGSESGTFSYTVGASEQGAWRVMVVKDWWGTIATGVEVSSAATGTNANPDPPSFNPTNWDVEDTFWRAVFAGDDGRPSVSAFPTNYDIFQNDDKSNGSGGACMGSAGRNNAVASENPGTFTKSGTGSGAAWVSWLIAIRPAAPAIAIPHLRQTRRSNQAVKRGTAW